MLTILSSFFDSTTGRTGGELPPNRHEYSSLACSLVQWLCTFGLPISNVPCFATCHITNIAKLTEIFGSSMGIKPAGTVLQLFTSRPFAASAAQHRLVSRHLALPAGGVLQIASCSLHHSGALLLEAHDGEHLDENLCSSSTAASTQMQHGQPEQLANSHCAAGTEHEASIQANDIDMTAAGHPIDYDDGVGFDDDGGGVDDMHEQDTHSLQGGPSGFASAPLFTVITMPLPLPSVQTSQRLIPV